MGNKFAKGFALSVKVCNLYDELINLVQFNGEDSSEFNRISSELQNLVVQERNAYNSLELMRVEYYIKLLDDYKLDDCYMNRYFSKLICRKNLILYEDFSVSGFTLDAVIDGKILIDTIKKVDMRIKETIPSDFQEKLFSEDLSLIHKIQKYSFLSKNEYVENLSLSHNFDIDMIPSISLESISMMFGANQFEMNLYQNVFVSSAIELINHLFSDIYMDTIEIEMVYSTLLRITEFEVLLEQLNIKAFSEVIRYFNSIVKGIKRSPASDSVRNLLVKRRNTFNCGK